MDYADAIALLAHTNFYLRRLSWALGVELPAHCDLDLANWCRSGGEEEEPLHPGAGKLLAELVNANPVRLVVAGLSWDAALRLQMAAARVLLHQHRPSPPPAPPASPPPRPRGSGPRGLVLPFAPVGQDDPQGPSPAAPAASLARAA